MVKVIIAGMLGFLLLGCQPDVVGSTDEAAGGSAATVTDPTLLAALRADSPAEQIAALRTIGNTADPSYVRAVLPLLNSQDGGVYLAAVGALSQLGDPSAVEPIIASVPYRDHDRLLDVMPAIANLGGEDAEAFLDALTSHSDPRIRARALSLTRATP